MVKEQALLLFHAVLKLFDDPQAVVFLMFLGLLTCLAAYQTYRIHNQTLLENLIDKCGEVCHYEVESVTEAECRCRGDITEPPPQEDEEIIDP